MQFRCPPGLKERVDALVRAGLYTDFSSFVVAALENQLLLEEAHATTPRPAEPPQRRAESVEARAAPQEIEYERLHEFRPGIIRAAPMALPSSGPDITLETGGFRGLELLPLAAEPPFPLPQASAADQPPDQPVSIDKWVWGQYNRLLPAKVSMRALAVMVAAAGDARPLADAAPQIAELALRFGAYLRELDDRFQTHRDDALATAFPRHLPGRLRFQNHFVGHAVEHRAGGLLADYRFIEARPRKGHLWVLPTAAGWHFARLPNPLFNGPPPSSPPARFSDEEIHFLLDHIRRFVPVEVFAVRAVLSLIEQDRKTPDALTEGLARYLPEGSNPAALRDVLSTQRTGVLARAADLGLVRRLRDARFITYQVTDSGKAFLSSVGGVIPKKMATPRGHKRIGREKS
jgi:hypothetical protein